MINTVYMDLKLTNLSSATSSRQITHQRPLITSDDSVLSSSASKAAAQLGISPEGVRDVSGLISHFRALPLQNKHLSQQIIDELRHNLNQSSAVPVSRVVKSGSGGFNLIRSAPEIDTIILPGGGAKGVVYVALMRVLYNAFPGVKNFIGSSAGSLAAVFMSFNKDHNKLQSMLASELPTLLDTQVKLREIYPGLKFKNTMSTTARAIWTIMGRGALGEANGLVQKLDEITSTAVSEYLNALKPNDLHKKIDAYCQAKSITGAAKHKLESRMNQLKEVADFTRNREEAMITFSDLDVLHFMAPQEFKNVQVTGFDTLEKNVKYFNFDKTPHMPVVYAARASMSHPLLAEGVLDPAGFTIIDGGIGSNTPCEGAYPNHDIARATGEPGNARDEEIRARTLVLKFDHNYQNAPSKKRNAFKKFFTKMSKRFLAWFMRYVSDNPNRDKNCANDKAKFNAAGTNGYVLHHGDLRTIELNVSADRQQRAIDEATIGLLAQALQRKNQGYFVRVNSIKEAAARLSDAERRQILNAGKPKPEHFGCIRAKQAYERSKAAYITARKNPKTSIDSLAKAKNKAESARIAHEKKNQMYKNALELYQMVISHQLKQWPPAYSQTQH